MKRIIIIQVLALALFSCTKPKTDEQKPVSIPVSTAVSVEQYFQPQVHYAGTVEANFQANLGATLPGKVEKIYFSEGSYVEKGALLVELSDEMLTQAIVENEALVKDFGRISRLKQKGSISEMEYDHLKAKLEASDSKVELMKRNTRIYAPFSGIIAEIYVHEGENFSLLPSIDQQNLSISNGILNLMQISPVKVSIDVPEKELSTFKQGMNVEITLDAYPNESFQGKVKYIKPFLSKSSRTVTIEIEAANRNNLMKPGMSANVLMELLQTKGVFIPLEAIHRQAGTSNEFVFAIKDARAAKIPVKLISTMGSSACVSGIEPGTEIAISGKSKLNDGSLVKVSNQ